MRTGLPATACLAALAAAAPAFAQDPVEVESAIIEVARLPTTPADAPGLRIVDEAEIEALQATVAADILTIVPGLSLYSEGAFGGITSVRIRGASTDKTLVLVDGVPMNDPASPSGAYDFSSLDLAHVRRVEILSGPQGSLWGSAAIGGVINFTTRDPVGLEAGLEGGSFSTLRAQASAGISEPDHAVSAYVSAFRTDGISQADAADGNTEADGFETVTVGVAARARPAPRVELEGRVRHTDSEVDLDGFPPPLFLLDDTADRSESRTWSGFVRARVEGVLGLDHTLSISLYDTEREGFGAFPGVFTAERRLWRYTAEHDRSGDRWGLIGGIEHERSRGDASFTDAVVETTALFGVARFDVAEAVRATVGLRHDAPRDFDAETTLRLALAADLGAGFRATASWGQGFKTPTVSQIVCDFCFTPAAPLSPETAEGWDITLGWRSPDRRVQASLTWFRLDVADQIAYVGGHYENIDSTSADGIEADLEAELGGGFRLKAGYAWTDAVDNSTGLELLRAPAHSGSATLFWERGLWDAALTVRAESDQRDVAGFGAATRDGFVTADLAVGYDLNRRVRLTARIENLTDAHYQEAFGYGQPGLSGYVGVRLRY